MDTEAGELDVTLGYPATVDIGGSGVQDRVTEQDQAVVASEETDASLQVQLPAVCLDTDVPTDAGRDCDSDPNSEISQYNTEPSTVYSVVDELKTVFEEVLDSGEGNLLKSEIFIQTFVRQPPSSVVDNDHSLTVSLPVDTDVKTGSGSCDDETTTEVSQFVTSEEVLHLDNAASSPQTSELKIVLGSLPTGGLPVPVPGAGADSVNNFVQDEKSGENSELEKCCLVENLATDADRGTEPDSLSSVPGVCDGQEQGSELPPGPQGSVVLENPLDAGATDMDSEGLQEEGGTRGKRDTSGNGNLGLKEVEFKLDIGKRRLPSPDVKKVEKVRAPEFVVKPRRQFVDEGQSAKFKVSYDGSQASLSWSRNGKPLASGSKFKIYEKDGYHYLEVLNVESGDSGVYISKVENSAGTDTASAELDVFSKPKLLTRGAKPPTLVTPLQDVSVALGDTDVRLECHVADADDCDVTWYHDGKEIRQGRRYRCRFTGAAASLNVTEVGEDEAGLYECVLSNASGEVRTSCTLSTDGEKLEPPVFTKELQDLEVEDGDKVELVVEVKGTLPIHVYWLHNNRQVTVDTPGCVLRAADGVHSLTIPHAGAESAGEYVCEAYNDYGDTDTFCRISVAEVDKSDPPEFLTRPKLLTIEEGTNATFTCSIKGHPSPTVKWERNGCTLSTDKKYKISCDGSSHSLEILAPNKSDAGQYICRVENCAGSVSHTCSLVISQTKPTKSATDFRNLLKSREPVGQIGKQGSTESERSDKENEVRDFRSLLRKNRQATPPPSTTRDSKTPTTNASGAQRPVSTSLNARGGLRRTVDSLEKTPSTQEQNSNRLTSGPFGDRVKSAPVKDNVFTKSSSQQSHIAPGALKTSSIRDPPKTSDSRATDLVKPDFRSVLSSRQRNVDQNVKTSVVSSRLQVKDTKPSWSKDSSSDSIRNEQTKDVKTLTPGKIDYRSVLKNRQTPDKEEKSQPTKDLKTIVQSKDPRSTVLGRKSVFEEKQNGHSPSNKGSPAQTKSTLRPVPTKDIGSLKSRFESPSRDFRDVQLKHVKPPESTEKPSIRDSSKRPTELTIQTSLSTRKETLSAKKEPEVTAKELEFGRLAAFSPLSDSSFLSDSSKVSDNSKTSEASATSEDSEKGEVPQLTDFQSCRKVNWWRENGRAGRRRSSDTSQRPSIQDRLADQRVRYGSKAVLQCTVVGVPEPDIKWSINQKLIKPSKFFRLSYAESVAQLVIAETFSEDEGEYTCTATNTAGTDSCSCYLTVEASSSQSSRSEGHAFEGPVHTPPRVLSLLPRDVTVQRGQPVRIDVAFCGEPAPSVRWFQAKTELSPDKHFKIMSETGKSSLVIDTVSPNDAGRFTVTVTNDLGSDLMSATITVEDVPEPPIGKPHVYDISKRSVSLSWCGPPFDGGCQVTHYAIEVRDSVGQQWTTLTSDCQSTSYHALNLTPERSYQFRVRAGNKLGLSDPSDTSEVVVMTDPLQTSEDYESDGASEVFSPTVEFRGRDELPFDPRQVDIKPGRKFEDHYEQLQEVGKGKFGNVYKCREKATGKYWAAKVVKCREKEKDNLRLEVKVMNELAHPKLLMLYDAFEEPRKMVLVMEYVGAGELFERVIREDFELTERDCVHFLRQICSGVGYMHSRSILHLDLKPENVLCVSDNSNQIKIIDFGLARFYQPGESVRVLFGTPEFIAPEVINYDEISYATDLWSIGVICYILLSGLSPFLGDSDAETLANVTSGEYDFDDDSFEDISENAKDFIRRLLIKRKEKRNTISECLQHPWLTQEDMRIRCKRLNTERLKCFMARRKWQKTGNAIRALGRMASLQKMLQGGSSSSTSSVSSTPVQTPTPTSSGPGSALAPVFDSPTPSKNTPETLSTPAKVVPDPEQETKKDQPTPESGNKSKGDNSLTSKSGRDRPGVTFEKASKSSDASPASRRKLLEKDTDLSAVSKSSDASPATRRKVLERYTDTEGAASRLTQRTESPASTAKTTTTAAAASERSPQDQSKDHLPRTHNTNGLSPSHVSHLDKASQEEKNSPSFVKEMVDCTAFCGDVVRFDVKVTGDPTPELVWTFEDETVEEDERHILELGGNGNCSLIVRSVTEDDEGEYSCTAKNRHGEVTCSAELTVYGTGGF